MEPLLLLWVFLYGQFLKMRERRRHAQSGGPLEENFVAENVGEFFRDHRSLTKRKSDEELNKVPLLSADELLRKSFFTQENYPSHGEHQGRHHRRRSRKRSSHNRNRDHTSTTTTIDEEKKSIARLTRDSTQVLSTLLQDIKPVSSENEDDPNCHDENLQRNKKPHDLNQYYLPANKATANASTSSTTLRETKRLSLVALALTTVGGFASGWIHHEFSIFHPEHHKNAEEWDHLYEKLERDQNLRKEERLERKRQAFVAKYGTAGTSSASSRRQKGGQQFGRAGGHAEAQEIGEASGPPLDRDGVVLGGIEEADPQHQSIEQVDDGLLNSSWGSNFNRIGDETRRHVDNVLASIFGSQHSFNVGAARGPGDDDTIVADEGFNENEPRQGSGPLHHDDDQEDHETTSNSRKKKYNSSRTGSTLQSVSEEAGAQSEREEESEDLENVSHGGSSGAAASHVFEDPDPNESSSTPVDSTEEDDASLNMRSRPSAPVVVMNYQPPRGRPAGGAQNKASASKSEGSDEEGGSGPPGGVVTLADGRAEGAVEEVDDSIFSHSLQDEQPDSIQKSRSDPTGLRGVPVDQLNRKKRKKEKRRPTPTSIITNFNEDGTSAPTSNNMKKTISAEEYAWKTGDRDLLYDPDSTEDDDQFDNFHWHAAVWKYLHQHSYLLGVFEIGPHNAEFVGLILALLHSMCQAVFLVSSKSALSSVKVPVVGTGRTNMLNKMARNGAGAGPGGSATSSSVVGATTTLPPGRGFATSCWIGMVFTLSIDGFMWFMEPKEEDIRSHLAGHGNTGSSDEEDPASTSPYSSTSTLGGGNSASRNAFDDTSAGGDEGDGGSGGSASGSGSAAGGTGTGGRVAAAKNHGPLKNNIGANNDGASGEQGARGPTAAPANASGSAPVSSETAPPPPPTPSKSPAAGTMGPPSEPRYSSKDHYNARSITKIPRSGSQELLPPSPFSPAAASQDGGSSSDRASSKDSIVSRSVPRPDLTPRASALKKRGPPQQRPSSSTASSSSSTTTFGGTTAMLGAGANSASSASDLSSSQDGMLTSNTGDSSNSPVVFRRPKKRVTFDGQVTKIRQGENGLVFSYEEPVHREEPGDYYLDRMRNDVFAGDPSFNNLLAQAQDHEPPPPAPPHPGRIQRQQTPVARSTGLAGLEDVDALSHEDGEPQSSEFQNSSVRTTIHDPPGEQSLSSSSSSSRGRAEERSGRGRVRGVAARPEGEVQHQGVDQHQQGVDGGTTSSQRGTIAPTLGHGQQGAPSNSRHSDDARVSFDEFMNDPYNEAEVPTDNGEGLFVGRRKNMLRELAPEGNQRDTGAAAPKDLDSQEVNKLKGIFKSIHRKKASTGTAAAGVGGAGVGPAVGAGQDDKKANPLANSGLSALSGSKRSTGRSSSSTSQLSKQSKWKVVQNAMEHGDLSEKEKKKERAEKVFDIVKAMMHRRSNKGGGGGAGPPPVSQRDPAGGGPLGPPGATPFHGSGSGLGKILAGLGGGGISSGSGLAQQPGGGSRSSGGQINMVDGGTTSDQSTGAGQHQEDHDGKINPVTGSASGKQSISERDHLRHWVRYYLLDWMWMKSQILTACSVFLIFFCQYATKFWLVKTLDMLNMTIVESIKMICTVFLVTMFLVPATAGGGSGTSTGGVGATGSASQSSDSQDNSGVVSELQILACLVTIAGGALFKIAEHYEKMIHSLHDEKKSVEKERDQVVGTMKGLAEVAQLRHERMKQIKEEEEKEREAERQHAAEQELELQQRENIKRRSHRTSNDSTSNSFRLFRKPPEEKKRGNTMSSDRISVGRASGQHQVLVPSFKRSTASNKAKTASGRLSGRGDNTSVAGSLNLKNIKNEAERRTSSTRERRQSAAGNRITSRTGEHHFTGVDDQEEPHDFRRHVAPRDHHAAERGPRQSDVLQIDTIAVELPGLKIRAQEYDRELEQESAMVQHKDGSHRQSCTSTASSSSRGLSVTPPFASGGPLRKSKVNRILTRPRGSKATRVAETEMETLCYYSAGTSTCPATLYPTYG
ncbi:unnamed protein product [Amoebophrya sp. A120]|nr:unnamed protein product [Amoebophrya sp. A120]|eukprot:GSA120T00009644001.1